MLRVISLVKSLLWNSLVHRRVVLPKCCGGRVRCGRKRRFSLLPGRRSVTKVSCLNGTLALLQDQSEVSPEKRSPFRACGEASCLGAIAFPRCTGAFGYAKWPGRGRDRCMAWASFCPGGHVWSKQSRYLCQGAGTQVSQGNVPGIETASLAMDTEEGVEVVWNEVQFSDKKVFKTLEDRIKEMFDNLMQVDHPNIVKFHKYWLDTKESRARVIFITEYMSSGSLKQFLKKTKKNHKTMNVKAWKRWCTQILSALNLCGNMRCLMTFSYWALCNISLPDSSFSSPIVPASYLHSCDPPIIHGNLTCDNIFIQHNGLIKIGSVFPDAVHGKVRHHRDDLRNIHFFAPEYGLAEDDYAIDIFSFGICALEMAVLEIQANGDAMVSKEAIAHAGDSLEDPLMREFTQSCVRLEAKKRPTAHDLLFHRVLFEVHSLKLLAAHCFINNQYLFPENCVEEKTKSFDPNGIMAEIKHADRPGVQLKYSHVSPLELDKFLEDVKEQEWPIRDTSVEEGCKSTGTNSSRAECCIGSFPGARRNGIYPLMNFASHRPHPVPRALSLSQEHMETVKTPTPEPQEMETRKVVQMHCNLESNEEGTRSHVSLSWLLSHLGEKSPLTTGITSFKGDSYKQLSLFLKMDDKLHRQLSCDVLPSESGAFLTSTLTAPPVGHVQFYSLPSISMYALILASDSPKDLANELVHYAFISE
ncbi:nuclear receptor-binding protein 2-like, partial [Scleropages formosus]